MARQARQTQVMSDVTVSKWDVLRELATARKAFDLSDRDLGVLQALVSFHPARMLDTAKGSLVVFPSNASICERLNGMPCSTMRRHLARLVDAGMIIRRDSPNGKRYARQRGEVRVAFGFDLSPLAHRFPEICDAAREVRDAADRIAALREEISLMRRDLFGLADYGKDTAPTARDWNDLLALLHVTSRALRRKLSLAELTAIRDRLAAELADTSALANPVETPKMSTSRSQNEQHYQSSNIDSYESERRLENAEIGNGAQTSEPPERHSPKKTITLTLAQVLATCRKLQSFNTDRITHWHDLVRAADKLRPMMGISTSVWNDARTTMGPEQAAIVVAAILERFNAIRSPGAYLRDLSNRARSGEFTCIPMVMALSRDPSLPAQFTAVN